MKIKCSNDVGDIIIFFGVLLLFLKIVGVQSLQALSYFAILCIIFWPVTLTIIVALVVLGVMVIATTISYYEEKCRKE